MKILPLFALSLVAVSTMAHATPLDISPITRPIVPTANPVGDRDFDGNATLVVGVELSVERQGRAIFAHVTFSGRENGGDGTRTSIGPVPIEVWRWKPADGPNFVHAINGATQSVLRTDAGKGCSFGCGTIGAAEDGGLIRTVPNRSGGPVQSVVLLGDTSGDDISTDNNPHGDTSIRRINFNTIDVTFGSTLIRR